MGAGHREGLYRALGSRVCCLGLGLALTGSREARVRQRPCQGRELRRLPLAGAMSRWLVFRDVNCCLWARELTVPSTQS